MPLQPSPIADTSSGLFFPSLRFFISEFVPLHEVAAEGRVALACNHSLAINHKIDNGAPRLILRTASSVPSRPYPGSPPELRRNRRERSAAGKPSKPLFMNHRH